MNEKTPKGRYRSKVRDEPRTLISGNLVKSKKESQPVGTLNYLASGPTFNEIFHAGLTNNNQTVEEEYIVTIKRLTETFNYQYELASHYLWLIYCPIGVKVNPAYKVLTPCFHKSLISLSSAFYLTRHGLWGPARPLIRHSFESLVISKFCSLNSESDVFDRWIDGVDLYFTNSVLKKIRVPSTEQFKQFWSLMSDYTHSSIYASQPDLLIGDQAHEVGLNFVLIEMMMECKYHLLISHIITDSMKYYQGAHKGKSRAQELRKLLSSNYSTSKKHMGKDGKKLILDYKSRWSIDM